MAIVDLRSHPAAYVTVPELALYFDVSPWTVRKWYHQGLLEAYDLRRPGSRLRRVTTLSARRFERDQWRQVVTAIRCPPRTLPPA